MRFVALGVGDAFSERYYSTCLAVVADDGTWLLVDCPHPIRKILREGASASGIELPLAKLAGVALTHLHADHASGLEGFGAYWKYHPPGPEDRPVLFAGEQVMQAFRARREAELFRLRTVLDGTAATRTGPFVIESRRTLHGNMPAYAFRFSADGRTLGHSGDTAFDPELVRWLAAADRFIHEVGGTELDSDQHTHHAHLAALPDDVRRKMWVAHAVDEFDPAKVGLEPLRQGQVYAV